LFFEGTVRTTKSPCTLIMHTIQLLYDSEESLLEDGNTTDLQRKESSSTDSTSTTNAVDNPLNALNVVHKQSADVTNHEEEKEIGSQDQTHSESEVATASQSTVVAITTSKSTSRKLSAATARLSFLWQSYHPKYWYWELVETTRRLMLTAVLTVCGSGTSQQALLAILLTLCYVRLYTYFSPYADNTDAITAETGLFQIVFSYLGSLNSLLSLLQPKFNTLVDVLLVLVNLSVPGLALYFEVVELNRRVAVGEVKLKDTEKEQTVDNSGKEGVSDGEVEMSNL
jgi:hypothetical protein